MHHRLRANSAAIAAALALTIGFAACGSDSKSSDTTTEETTPAKTDETTEVTEAEVATTVEATDATEVTTTDVDTTDVETTEAAPTTARATTTTGGSAATSTTADAGTPAVPADWQAYTSPDGGYTAAFPATPKEQSQSTPLADGATLTLVIVSAQNDDQVFFATAHGEYPAGTVTDVATSLQGAQDQAIANVKGTLIDSQDITLQGRPGRQFSASVTSNGAQGTVVQRVFLDGDTIFENIVVGPDTIQATDDDVAAFFGSFAFTS